MDTRPTSNLLDYYATPGVMTDPGEMASLFEGLPREIPEICQLIQNNLIHIFWADRYGRTLSEAEKETVSIRQVDRKLTYIHQNDPNPLTSPRPLAGTSLSYYLPSCDIRESPPGLVVASGHTFSPITLKITGCVNIGMNESNVGSWLMPSWTIFNAAN